MQAQRARCLNHGGEAAGEFLEGQRLIVDLDRRQRPHPQHHLVHHAQQAEARTQHPHQVAIPLRDGHLPALRRDQFDFRDAGRELRHACAEGGLRQGGDGRGAQGNLADFGGQRQFQTAFGERAHQRAHPYAGLRPDEGFAELDDFVECAGVDRGAAVAPDAAGLRVVGADDANGGGIALVLAQENRNVLEALDLEDEPRAAINT